MGGEAAQWYTDLGAGRGAAAGLPFEVREVLAAATEDIAREARTRRAASDAAHAASEARRAAEDAHRTAADLAERHAVEQRNRRIAASSWVYDHRVVFWLLGVVVVTAVLILALPIMTILWLLIGLIGLCCYPFFID